MIRSGVPHVGVDIWKNRVENLILRYPWQYNRHHGFAQEKMSLYNSEPTTASVGKVLFTYTRKYYVELVVQRI